MKNSIKVKTAGVVLAGGLSRRFGEPKAFAIYNGKRFLDYSLNALKDAAESLAVVCRKEHKQEIAATCSANIIEDLEAVKGQGPLAGIYSAMSAVPADWYIILPCDAPLVPKSAVQYLKTAAEKEMDAKAIVPVNEEGIQPLIAVYHADAKALILDLLVSGKQSMKAFLDEIPVRYIEGDLFNKEYLANINDQEALSRLTENDI
ncbi:molybdenum cofactor guanylyltransferase [Metabacillus sp. GX 13764]|uniref:molybdenum cofactor guanylyltransferase n=1 Tax=Metabacillus kandeliae TaxID=2900151 RepID=UPI001E5C0F50|nr:molybdenum cofactor guanylyltransferase [Metabacillus kandeliae]MCD7033571.1 molybdenum cofactor guanylyltransferase [Metabacillus kandeliae]